MIQQDTPEQGYTLEPSLYGQKGLESRLNQPQHGSLSVLHTGKDWWLLVYSMCDCWWECYWSNIGGNLKVATWSENPFLTLQRSMYIWQDTIIKPLSLHSQWSVAIMTTLRPFCCEDLFKYNNVNLDPLTETYNLAFYLMYLSR